jgi:hypothetical protein
LRHQGRVVLAIDGLQPDVGHEVLWVLRDCLSGEILLARSLLSSTIGDLSALIAEVRRALPVPITGAISDGQDTIRKAVARTLPGVPHQACHFHYLREAAKPIYEADRHAKKELKKRVRGAWPIERAAEEEGGATGTMRSPRSCGVTGRGCSSATSRRSCRGRTTTWSTSFGSHRYHERRASGRRRASPGLVVMGSVRVISSLATRLRPEEGLVLPGGYVERWREMRAGLDKLREARRKQRRFRRNPTAISRSWKKDVSSSKFAILGEDCPGGLSLLDCPVPDVA